MRTTLHEQMLISDDSRLLDLAEAISGAEIIAIDTEFVRERTYYPQLCLLQVATDEVIGCVDCCVELDLAPLFDAIFRPDCSCLLHSAKQDLEVLWNASRRLPATLADTQVAAALLGFAPQLGLQDLLAETLEINLDKSHTRTDWTRRPLPEPALHYALDDVRHLIPVWRLLRQRLVEMDRLEWCEEDCARLLAEPPVPGTETVWQRLRSRPSWSLDQHCAALSLVRWREREAQKLNRPRRWVVSDELIADIAKAMPRNRTQLDEVAQIPARLVSRSGTNILAAIRESESAELRATVQRLTPASKPDKEQLKTIQAHAKLCADKLNIHAEVLATRRDLAALVSGEVPEALSSGWRANELKR